MKNSWLWAAALGAGVLFLATSAGASSAPEPGQGGIVKTLMLKGRNGDPYVVVFFGDGSRLVQTVRASFYTQGATPIATKVVKGSPSDVQFALSNLPE